MKKEIVVSCMKGYVKSLKESKDEAFAQGLSGDGMLIVPADEKVIAPFDGRVVLVFDTKHAIILRSNEGLAFIIHVGVDTSKLKGRGFQVFVEDGQAIKQGDVLMNMDFEYLNAIHYDKDTHLLFPSLGIKKLINIHYGKIDHLFPLCEIQ